IEGRIILARNVHWTLPAYIGNAIESPLASDRLIAVESLTHLYRIGNDVVRAAVTAQAHRLATDDSRMVSAAAAKLLQTTTEADAPRDSGRPEPAKAGGVERPPADHDHDAHVPAVGTGGDGRSRTPLIRVTRRRAALLVG